MPFEKGISGNPNGRPIGAVSDKVKMWNELGEWFTQQGAAKCMRIMNEMEDEEYIKHYTALLGDEKSPVVINVHSDL